MEHYKFVLTALEFTSHYILHSHISQQVQILSKLETVFHLFCAFICQPVRLEHAKEAKHHVY